MSESPRPALGELARMRDELLSLITVPPPPRRSPSVQGYHSVDVIERAIKAIDAVVALATGGAEEREEGCWAYDCETAAAIDAVLIEKGIREHPDEGAYSAEEWARSVVRVITEAANEAALTPERPADAD